MKGILKKISACLKMAVVMTPIVLVPLGLIAGLVGGIGGAISENNYKKSLFENEKVIIRQEQELDILEERFTKGELTPSEYAEKVEHVKSEEYIDDILNLPEFEEENAILKQKDKVYDSIGLSGLGAIGLGLLMGTSLAINENAIKILDSAENDWYYKDNKKSESDTLEIKY